MIIANLATYPPRRDSLKKVVDTIAPQVDHLKLVLNQYDAVLPEFADYPNVEMILPPRDLKDVGKFYPDSSHADYVFYIDDDITYPADYVAKSCAALDAISVRAVGGYYGSIYTKPPFGLSKRELKLWLLSLSRRRIARCRKVFQIFDALEAPVIVDQLGTGVVVMRGADTPPFDYMQGSEKFVDVRLAKWCFENQISAACLPRPADWLSEVPFDDSIYQGFTSKDPRHVADEIRSYAYKIANRGQELR